MNQRRWGYYRCMVCGIWSAVWVRMTEVDEPLCVGCWSWAHQIAIDRLTWLR